MSPTFDFQCREHGVTEVYVRPSDPDELIRCKVCNEPTQRMFPTPLVIYRGDGWAKKDRSSKGKS